MDCKTREVRVTGVPEGAQGPQQSEDPQHPEDFGATIRDERNQDVDDRDHHQHSIQNIPAALQVRFIPQTPAQSYYLQNTEINSFIHPRV